jgi:hypothetical protein
LDDRRLGCGVDAVRGAEVTPAMGCAYSGPLKACGSFAVVAWATGLEIGRGEYGLECT